MSSKRLMVMAGGTGGHVFPGLAVAHHLIEQGWQVRWLGTADRMEADLVPKHGIEIEFIRISGLRGKGIKALLLSPVRIFNAWRQARRIMKSWQPDVVLGMGGYVSGPGGLAAWSCGIPVVLHEQNGIAGLTNKWLAKIATKVMQAFPGAFPTADVVGNPVRTDVLALPLPAVRLSGRTGPIRVLVVGGSQGARVLNQTLPQVAAELGDAITLWHQTGKGALEQVQQAYRDAGQPQHKVTEFIDDMAEAYAWADVVVCRSGALTVSEVAAAGLPAIFVPFQHKDRQQYWNALPLEKAGAAKIFEQPQFTATAVADTLRHWDRPTLLAMAEKARQVAIPDATDRVAQEVARVAK
ncbi:MULTISPECIES: undecaprenyldiphospho-muramoylpentapeptide beta-N-acetylglucosaminyltransferase [Pantoea]|jgi:UDP-N-acetylglucosamine--N-acetylmuramyl-(pentapeptide) pyrophosphoryl-undecaprenol N-acetylglucosamine transferase|uniref:UDP-N-acetylglucosamine--N-acetylmuramyl-(pentapeptide) pyrophosphoryl-undecaprenol N-acetylglucosamine transferase n=2 Tax=Pantoea TaxID=53335 RepID=A0A1X1D1U6_9GAMM|nr:MULTISPECIES: undecaprenyldiphospho-muramoylpentapeptide beta-N-acetylglucosaminyltransferase [Pantoea]MDF7646966.1 undecaprenyldiphospho-muramoylpentapeptide beta-N-acetylglucosaminyltransferase [Erwiniaceae bacterium L1_54_3]NIF01013.1 undecaprenyldiphospho-muramoylpentapeptide beta-N-acetylglucosaminyltransferase [Pantoea formicae]ORM70574.1 undecaprenyldiphospho-muramoylpentapeptide beta-N-acetylglucosaminyltransferase [Pantoea rwandensis]